MKKLEAKKIINEYGLGCKPSEFVEYYNNLNIDLDQYKQQYTATKHTFDEKYNGTTIDNPANGKYYYVLT